MLKRALLALLIAALPSLAFGQSTVLQGGSWTQAHGPMYGTAGGSQPVIIDSGPAGGGQGLGLSEQLIVARGFGAAPYAGQGTGPLGTNWCDYDAPITNSTGYHYLCLSSNAQGGGLLNYGADGGASELPLHFIINGVTYTFPGDFPTIPVTVINGGTGRTSLTSHDLLIGNGTDPVTLLAPNSTPGIPLVSNGASADPGYGVAIVAGGGTGLTSGTSGGVPYFSAGSTMASSAVLAANQLVVGGGAASPPATLGSLGTTSTVLHGNAAGAPSFGAVSLTADVSGILPGVNGGTGVANTGKAITLGGNYTTSGAHDLTFTLTGDTNITLPTSGTIISNALTNTHILVGNVSGVATDVAMSGDCGLANTGAITCTKLNSVSYGTGPSTNTVPVVTGTNAVTYETVPNAALANSSLTIAGHLVSLGGSQAIACADLSNGATGCSTATGTSGATIPLLNGANTWSGVQSFNSGDLALKGASSGTITLNAPTAAGSNTITFPAGTTDFSSTGGTSQVVKQVSSGAALTVGQLACSDLSNGATGCSTATGTSGATIPLLNGVNTWSSNQTFSGVLLGSNGSAGSPTFSFTNNLNMGMFSQGTNRLSFSTNSVIALSIDSSQTVELGGVATGASARFLSVASNVNYMDWAGGATGNNPSLNLRGETNVGLDVGLKGSGVFSLFGTGGISTAQAKITAIASDAAQTDSTVCVNSSGVLLKGSGTIGICLGTSSARYKGPTTPLHDGLDQVSALKPVSYRYKKGYGDSGAKEQYGFLAEDVVSVLPILVGLDGEDRPNSVDLVGMIPVLVRAVQQQQEQINALRH